MFNSLELIYKLIVHKLAIKSEDPDELNPSEMNMIDVLTELVDDGDLGDDQLVKTDLSCFNLKEIKVKNVFHLWKVFVDFYFDMKDI